MGAHTPRPRAARGRRGALRRLGGGVATDGGSFTLELVIVFPAVLLLIFATVQGALWYHGRTLAMLAAQDGLRVAQQLDGTSEAGRARAAATLALVGGEGFIHSPSVAASRTGTQAVVIVRGTAMALFPGLHLPIQQGATGPVERFTEAP